jgi:parallel beta helix pectate lyase-like protein
MKKCKKIIPGVIVILLLLAINVYAADYVMFNYNGQIKVQGSGYTGSGLFKFAIINNSGSKTLWSNDMSSSAASEPSSYLSIGVDNGIFNVMIGDPDTGMSPINRSVFNYDGKIKLRIWFSDGTHGFQRLNPDHRLVNTDLLGYSTGSDDFTIYVNGTTGDDENNGLATGTAKKTIQAAVDILPERILCNVTISVADGTYREQVLIKNKYPGSANSSIIITGNTTTPGSARVTGSDVGADTVAVRDSAFRLENVPGGFTIEGFLVDRCADVGIYGTESSFVIQDCEIKNCHIAATATRLSNFTLNDTEISNNYSGVTVTANSVGDIKNCIIEDITNYHGVGVSSGSSLNLSDSRISRINGAGVVIFEASRANILNCTIEICGQGNYFWGVDLWDTSFCKIYKSLIQNCVKGGTRSSRCSFLQFKTTTDLVKNTLKNNPVGLRAEYMSGIENMNSISLIMDGNTVKIETAYNSNTYFIP